MCRLLVFVEIAKKIVHRALCRENTRLFLEELLAQAYNSVLVVTHAGVIRALMALVQKLSLEEAFHRTNISYVVYAE